MFRIATFICQQLSCKVDIELRNICTCKTRVYEGKSKNTKTFVIAMLLNVISLLNLVDII